MKYRGWKYHTELAKKGRRIVCFICILFLIKVSNETGKWSSFNFHYNRSILRGILHFFVKFVACSFIYIFGYSLVRFFVRLVLSMFIFSLVHYFPPLFLHLLNSSRAQFFTCSILHLFSSLLVQIFTCSFLLLFNSLLFHFFTCYLSLPIQFLTS